VTVAEFPNDEGAKEGAWAALVDHVQGHRPDLVLLPEMPFHPWPMAARQFDAAAWDAAVAAHGAWLPRLDALAPAVVAATRPVTDGGARYNEGFLWIPGEGYRPVHRKVYLPEEAGFWEASWYRAAAPDFALTEWNGVRLGFLICTEQWFFAHAQGYGRGGAHLILSPRASLAPSTEKWVAGGRSVATVSGAYHLAANLTGPSDPGSDPGSDLGKTWGGTGWIMEPEEGDCLGRTSPSLPFLTLEIDLAIAERAKGTYPRYVYLGRSPAS
jgi:N-carbamoylputrescine amidase